LLLHPALNGYPFLFGDSWAYCCECPDGTRSPILGCALGPVVARLGLWGYVLVQCATAAYACTVLTGPVFGRRHRVALAAALVVSGAGICAGWVLADIWTLIGLICLFAVAVGRGFPTVLLLLTFACAAHFGNVPVFAMTALAFVPLVRRRAEFVGRVGVCMLLALALVAGANLSGGRLRLTSGNGAAFVASRMLHDFPELIEDICRDRPEFGLCRVQEDVRGWSQADPGSFMWIFIEQLGYDPDDFNRLSREIILYSLSGFPGYYPRHAAAAVRNTVELMSVYALSDGHAPYARDPYVVDSMRRYFPEQVGRYLGSPQGDGRLQALLERVETPATVVFWVSAVACGAYVAFRWRSLRTDLPARYAVFALMSVTVNAVCMSNLSGVFTRYHTRVGFLVIFAGLALASERLRRPARPAAPS
jgi:hypothetical protein